MTTLEQALTSEKILRNRIDKLIDNGKKTAIAKRTAGFYETKITDLKQLWSDYCKADQSVREIILTNQEKDTSGYITEDFFGNTELKYSEYMGELLEGMRKCSPTQEATTGATIGASTGAITAVVREESLLPKIALPKYNGDYDTWRSFHDIFISLVHDNTRLTPVQKLHHLKACLTGEAEKLLRHTPITNADYDPAWAKLKERYENKRVLVNHQLKTLTNQTKLTTETASGVKSLLDTTEECMQQLKILKVDISSWDVILIYLVVQKLPFQTLKLWEEEQGASQELPTYEQFTKFLKTRVKILESISDTLVPKRVQTAKETIKAHHAIKATNKCPACNGMHFVQKCPKYQAMDAKLRRKVINSAGRCINCLSSTHLANKCTSKYRCLQCNARHHTTLHEHVKSEQAGSALNINARGPEHSASIQQNPFSEQSAPASSIQKPENYEERAHLGTNFKQSQGSPSFHTSSEVDNIQSFVARKNHEALLSTALVLAQTEQGQTRVLRCLVDTGSQSSFITQDACKTLNAKRTAASIKVTGLNTSPAGVSHEKTTLILRSCGPNPSIIKEEFLIMKKITDSLPTKVVSTRDCKHLQDIQLADPTFWRPGKVDALLGARVYAQIIQEGIKRGSKTALIAINTKFGWIVIGPTQEPARDRVASFISTSDESLSAQLTKFWESEEIAEKTILSKEDQECEDLYRATYQRLSSGRYQVKLPFKDNKLPELGESRSQALKRLNSLQDKFLRQPELEKDYRQCLNEYIELGHMVESDPPKPNERNYYIPHHAVLKESTTTKLRVVFDASAKTTNGKSLNNYQLKGPTIQPKLSATLLNWRKHKVAMHADIEKMYRMIEVHPDHRDFQRILWQHPKTKQIQDYKLTTVTFGTTSAPYLAIRTLQQLAQDEKQTWPLASNATLTSFYVDDLLTGASNVADAVKLQRELINMLAGGGFKLRKWASNSHELLETLPIEYRELKSSLTIADSDSIKTLGIRWHPLFDFFTYAVHVDRIYKSTTKRTILSQVASLYDPLGWLAPVIVVAKILIQTLWILGGDWDSPVSRDIEDKWETFKSDLPNLKNLKIPRWIFYAPGTRAQLHGFCDASEKAFAAVIYLRIEEEDGNIKSTLLTAKTKVAPIKPTTIPRLELNGAVLLARLLKSTVQDMRFENIPIFAWTDSTITLQWIKEHPSRWKVYVANRVVEIQESIKYDHWRHVSTKHNPADLASRGTTVSNMINNALWWHGPAWLIKKNSEWPEYKEIIGKTDLEAKQPTTKAANFFANIENEIFSRYSSFTRLKRIVAQLQRFKHNTQNPSEKATGYLTSTELKKGEITILKLVQKQEFAEEYESLTQAKPISKGSKLFTLNPFMDKTGLIRVGGRLEHAFIPYSRKHPIILPRKHIVTLLIIDKLHLETCHGGPSLVLNTSRARYWILDGRRSITTQIHKCIPCARYRSATLTQLMGNLPSARINIAKPFTKVGIDYAGPVMLKSSKQRNARLYKAYLCIFVCMATKAMHIELVSDLTSEGFLAALRRFIARRGWCTDIFSDCGTNFIGGRTILDKEMKTAIKRAEPEAAQHLAAKAITWHFNPPAAPHFGGIWEAGVKAVKYHLRRTLGQAKCTFEEYATVLAEIEACLNSRPLCNVRDNPDELFVLTPGHFLIGQEMSALPDSDLDEKNVPCLQRWKYCQLLKKQFWDKWSQEYLNHLQHRPKWCAKKENVNVGDIVLIKQENTSPTNWPLGKIDKVFPGIDNLVRVVQVRTKNGLLQRPIAKICLLPVDSNSQT